MNRGVESGGDGFLMEDMKDVLGDWEGVGGDEVKRVGVEVG